MRGVDTNILVYAHRDETPQHRKALQVLRELATGSEPWVLPWPCIYEFLRLVTHPRVFHPPTPPDEAWRAVESLLDSPSRVRLAEGERHREILAELLRTSAPEGNVLHDAHIAAASGARLLREASSCARLASHMAARSGNGIAG
jgi:toxin-antitoxin system PIN domain toxin